MKSLFFVRYQTIQYYYWQLKDKGNITATQLDKWFGELQACMPQGNPDNPKILAFYLDMLFANKELVQIENYKDLSTILTDYQAVIQSPQFKKMGQALQNRLVMQVQYFQDAQAEKNKEPVKQILIPS